MNLKLICQAIETSNNRVTYLDDTLILINGKQVSIIGNLVHSRGYSFRYLNPKDFIHRLKEAGLIDVSDEAIDHIIHSYRRSVNDKDPFIIGKRHEKH